MKIYFAGSVRGGRENAADYNKIISALQKDHVVLTVHLGDSKLTSSGENLPESVIFARDVAWIRESDTLVADVSVHAIGVGWEIGFAESLGKRIICLYNSNSEKKISTMIEGNPSITKVKYKTVDEALEKLLPLLR